MDKSIFIAIIGALVNAALSVSVPCLLKKSDQPFLTDVKKVYETNRQVILVSSLIIGVTIYLALNVSNEVAPMFSELTGINVVPSLVDTPTSVVSELPGMTPRGIVVMSDEFPAQLRNLIRNL